VTKGTILTNYAANQENFSLKKGRARTRGEEGSLRGKRTSKRGEPFAAEKALSPIGGKRGKGALLEFSVRIEKGRGLTKRLEREKVRSVT